VYKKEREREREREKREERFGGEGKVREKKTACCCGVVDFRKKKKGELRSNSLKRYLYFFR